MARLAGDDQTTVGQRLRELSPRGNAAGPSERVGTEKVAIDTPFGDNGVLGSEQLIDAATEQAAQFVDREIDGCCWPFSLQRPRRAATNPAGDIVPIFWPSVKNHCWIARPRYLPIDQARRWQIEPVATLRSQSDLKRETHRQVCERFLPSRGQWRIEGNAAGRQNAGRSSDDRRVGVQ